MNLQFGSPLSRAEMKKVLGGNQTVGCASHSDCNGAFPICVDVVYNGVPQGACCSAAKLRDKNDVCGGGQNVT